MATHFIILAWRIPWTEEPGGLQSMGLSRGEHDFHIPCTWQSRFKFRVPSKILRQNTLLFRDSFIPWPRREAQMMKAELFKTERIQSPFKSVAIRRTIDSETEQFPVEPKNWHIIVIRVCLLFSTFQIIFHSNIFKIYFVFSMFLLQTVSPN